MLGRSLAFSMLIVALVEPAGSARAQGPTTLLVSRAADGGPSDAPSGLAARGRVLSRNDRFVTFTSSADNLVVGDTRGFEDIFVRDLIAGTTIRVSVSSTGQEANDDSGFPAISGSGRFVVFDADATNLVPHDHNPIWSDVFVHDLLTGRTSLIDLSTSGQQGDDGPSYSASISGDGRFVAFGSTATNLVPGDTNGQADIFVRDRKLGTTERVSVSSTGLQGDDDSADATISANGRFVVFSSAAANLVPGDTNGAGDVFLHDRKTGRTERVSLSSSGDEGNDTSLLPDLSADGREVAFNSVATNLVPGDTNGTNDVFVRDRAAGTTERVSVSGSGEEGDGQCASLSISADGRVVAFDSYADNLVPNDTNADRDVFLHDRVTGNTRRVSVSVTGQQGDDGSLNAELSPDGRFLGFHSDATNLVPGDTNGYGDDFVRGPLSRGSI